MKPTGLTVPIWKYYDVDAPLRAAQRARGTAPIRWPAYALAGALRRCSSRPAVATYLRERHVMLAYLLRRAVWGVATVLGVLLFLFVLFFLVTEPQDVARRALGEKAPPEAIAQWLTNHGYDKPAVWNPERPARHACSPSTCAAC